MTTHLPGRIRLLGAADHELARATFALMSEVFETPVSPLSDAYLRRLLGSDAFVALAAVGDQDEVWGGLTAHVLPMTRTEEHELFIYDIAVAPARQRLGLGRRLVGALLDEGQRRGIAVSFVPADNEDDHALEFYRAIGGEAAPVTIFTFER